MASSWTRQFQVLLTKNRRLLSRRPIHLFVLLFSSIASVIFAWLAGRDARGPSGAFPPLTDCGMVDPLYVAEMSDYGGYGEARYEIPLSLNEPWRGGLPVWLLSLGPTAAGVSAFLILRDELQSRRWGMLKAADASAQWMSWFVAFSLLGLVNSLLGGITAVALPECHALEAVNFGSVFGTLWFLNMALVAASFFLAAICGTCTSTALTVFLVMSIVVASSAPAIGTAASNGYYSDAGLALNTYSSFTYGSGGAYWLYGSTSRVDVQYDYGFSFDPETGEYVESTDQNYTTRECEVPLVSIEEAHSYKSPSEQDEVPKEDIFQGCYVIASATTAGTPLSNFFWYWIPQYHFMAAWSSILGYTSLPGNEFSLAEASKSPEDLAQLSLANHLGLSEPSYDPTNTNGTSLFAQGSTIMTDLYYDWTRNYYSYGVEEVQESTCPSIEVTNLCSEYTYECAYPKPGFPSAGSPSVNGTMGLLVSLAVLYSFMAAYFMAVMPMGNGASLRCCFPFLPSYWCNRGSKSDDEEQDKGVEAVRVSKSYGTVQALKPFSLAMKPGEVTAILGHNGAGKSTFVNLLCCEQNPTSGDISVQGHSIASEQSSIQKIIGECKQDDIIWPSLTAREHLELFAGIRGVGKHEMAAIVEKWLDSVDLENAQHTRVSAFSGGMKRRLSVALATIGDASVIVLDEPTTGMDPVSRRFVWKHISEIREGRVILLTTHAMEEADLLADNVAILCNGELAAKGSPLELKTKHGSALQISLISDKDDLEAVEDAIQHTFADSLPHIQYNASDSGYSTLTIKKVCKEGNRLKAPTQAAVAVPVLNGETNSTPEVPALLVSADAPDGVPVDSLAEFIGWLEHEESPVREFGISSSSLEEVFLAVTRHFGPSTGTQYTHDNRGCCCCWKKRPKTSTEANNIESSAGPPLSQNMNQVSKAEVNFASYSRKLSVFTQTKAIVRFAFARNWTGRPSIVNWVIFSIFAVANMIAGFGMAVLWPEAGAWYLLLVTVCVLSFMLISVISPLYSDRNNGLFKMLLSQNMMERSFLLGTSLYSLMVQFAYTFVVLTLFFGSSIYRTAVIPDCGPDEPSYYTDDVYNNTWSSYDGSYDYQCGYAKFGQRPTVNPRYGQMEVLSWMDDGTEATVYAHIAPGGYELVLGIIVVFSLTFPGAVLSSAFLPGFKLSLVGISLVLLAACASPGILHATWALDPYWAGNYTEHVQSIYNCTSQYAPDDVADGFLACTGLLMSNPFILYTPPVAAILPQIGLFQTLSLSLMSDIVFYSKPEQYVDQIVAKLVENGASCTGSRCKFEYARELYGQNLGYMMLGAVLLLLLGLVLATALVFPFPWMVRARHSLGALFSFCKKQSGSSSSEVEELGEVDVERNLVHSIIQPILSRPEEVDIEANEASNPVLSFSARNEIIDQLPPVVMHKLRKVYPALGGAPEKVALNSLDLHVPRGQVLGLLGKNGAGKTTALNILAGVHDASSGLGLIAGYSCDSERNSVYERLGNCPQFDVVWRQQSVQRHLEFYARLKGIGSPDKAAWEIANAVGLGAPEVYKRPSGNLSGGMRRRLSIAVSLLGAPSTLLLDEPTTGLDPSTRNEIWNLASSFATPERAIVLTTHMMLEADALCSRIAIVAKGCLKVVGTQQHLKDNYGSGYLLQLNLAHDNDDCINDMLAFVKANIHEDAKIVTKQAKTIHINLPREIQVQKLFRTMYSDGAAEAMINQFLVSQSSLEDVFLALGE
ncbi:hypothetical protein ACHAXT_005899 [Thalassiosira profunda]